MRPCQNFERTAASRCVGRAVPGAFCGLGAAVVAHARTEPDSSSCAVSLSAIAVDFHPNGQLFTGGADKEVKVWEVSKTGGPAVTVVRQQLGAAGIATAAPFGSQLPHSTPQVERDADGYPTVRHLSSLTAHLSTVNCVRFSPTGAPPSQILPLFYASQLLRAGLGCNRGENPALQPVR